MLRAFPMLFLAAVSLFARAPSMPSHHSLSLLIPGDTVYLDRKGNEIKRSGASPLEKTFIVRTTLTTEDINAIRVDDSSKGKSHPISRKEARRTERFIRQGKFNEALATGNLVELLPLSIRLADWGVLRADNGKGGTDSMNNREYGITMDRNGDRRTYMGPVRDPAFFGTFVDIKISPNFLTYVHSHPSGTHDNSSFYQPPSAKDIEAAPAEGYCTVFGMGEDKKVYVYNHTGVIAVLSIANYINK